MFNCGLLQPKGFFGPIPGRIRISHGGFNGPPFPHDMLTQRQRRSNRVAQCDG